MVEKKDFMQLSKSKNKQKQKNYEKIKSNDDDTNDVFNDNGIFWANIRR